MWFKDAIGKALGEAAGKFATGAQALLASELRGLVWRELKFESIDYRPYGWQSCLTHIRKYGNPLYVGSVSVYNNTELGIPTHTTALFRYKNTFLLIRRYDQNNVSIFYPRGFDIGKMLRAASASSASTHLGHFDKNGDVSHITKEIRAKHLHCGKEHTALESDLRRWLQGEAVFREAGLPHRRGWLLYGKPGNGKTTCVQQLAVKYDMHIDVALFHKGRLITAPLSTKRFILIKTLTTSSEAVSPSTLTRISATSSTPSTALTTWTTASSSSPPTTCRRSILPSVDLAMRRNGTASVHVPVESTDVSTSTIPTMRRDSALRG